jgi:DNA-binding NtrC family response regulator
MRAAPVEIAGDYQHDDDGNMTTTVLLLVEDESALQELLHTELMDAGFEIATASNGKKALAELATDAERFRAVITDINLGRGPDGWEIGRRAREVVPAMPVVYMSGDSVNDWASKGVPNSVMLAKPFAPAQLITEVSRLITEADIHRKD